MSQVKQQSDHALWIPGPLPGMNEMLFARAAGRTTGRKRRDRYQRMKHQWTKTVAELARCESLPAMTARAWISFAWVEKDRRRDPDNVAAARKFVLDGLVKAGVLANDGQKQISGFLDTFHLAEDGRSPGVLVELWEVNDEDG